MLITKDYKRGSVVNLCLAPPPAANTAHNRPAAHLLSKTTKRPGYQRIHQYSLQKNNPTTRPLTNPEPKPSHKHTPTKETPTHGKPPQPKHNTTHLKTNLNPKHRLLTPKLILPNLILRFNPLLQTLIAHNRSPYLDHAFPPAPIPSTNTCLEITTNHPLRIPGYGGIKDNTVKAYRNCTTS